MTSRFQRSQVPTCGKAMNDWKLLGSPWGSRSFCSGGTDEYRVGLNKKTAPTEFPCHVWQLPAFAPYNSETNGFHPNIPTPMPCSSYFFVVLRLVYLLAWRRHGETLHMFLFFLVLKKSEDFRRFSAWGFGFHGWTFHVRWMVLLLWSFHQACWPQPHDVVFFVATPWLMVPPWGHNQVLGEEILERFAAVVSWPSKKEKDHSEHLPRMFVWMFSYYQVLYISWITYVAYVKSLLGLWKYNEIYLPCYLVGSFC